MDPKLTIAARIKSEDVERAIAAASPEFKGRLARSEGAITEMFFEELSPSDTTIALKESDSAILRLEVRLEGEGIWYDVHGVSASGPAEANGAL